MIVLNYPTKKELKTQIGKPLNYTETSMFGNEVSADCEVCGCNRPHLTGYKREFFANVTLKEGLIVAVS